MKNKNNTLMVVSPVDSGQRGKSYIANAEASLVPHRRLSHLLGRIAYHSFVGAFLVSIALLCVLASHLVPERFGASSGWITFAALTAVYVRWRRKRESRPKRPGGFLTGWGPYFRAIPGFVTHGGMLGFCVAMAVGHSLGIVIGGALLTALLFAWLHSTSLRLIEKKVTENECEIDAWIAAGEGEKRRRRQEYVQSGALKIGAVAAGVTEYPDAPKLKKPTKPNKKTHCMPGDSPLPEVNPATGLPAACGVLGGVVLVVFLWGFVFVLFFVVL